MVCGANSELIRGTKGIVGTRGLNAALQPLMIIILIFAHYDDNHIISIKTIINIMIIITLYCLKLSIGFFLSFDNIDKKVKNLVKIDLSDKIR